jgi:hypothetical protein
VRALTFSLKHINFHCDTIRAKPPVQLNGRGKTSAALHAPISGVFALPLFEPASGGAVEV